jgi:hypothetical protein
MVDKYMLIVTRELEFKVWDSELGEYCADDEGRESWDSWEEVPEVLFTSEQMLGKEDIERK